MDHIQIEINKHKNKLMNLINNLIITQLINEEISINNEIKTESECLTSLLNIKQKEILSINNNLINPIMFQPNQNIIVQPIDFNLNQINQNILQNNNVINDKIINVYFENRISGKIYNVQCKDNENFSKVVNIYREKAKDFKNDLFLFNAKKLDPFSNLTLTQLQISNFSYITVAKTLDLMGKRNKFRI